MRGGEGFRRMNDIESAVSRTSRTGEANIRAFAHASPAFNIDDYEMTGITVTKTIDQDSATGYR